MSITPFARPVVPPVYSSAARSSSARGTIGAGSALLERRERDEPVDLVRSRSGGGRCRCPSPASRTLSANSGVVITAAASASREHVAEVLGREQEVRRGDHRAGPPERLVDDPHLGRVGHRDDDPLARARPRARQSRGQPPGALEQLARAMPAALEQQRLVVALALERALGQPRQVVFADRRSCPPGSRQVSRGTRRRGSSGTRSAPRDSATRSKISRVSAGRPALPGLLAHVLADLARSPRRAPGGRARR